MVEASKEPKKVVEGQAEDEASEASEVLIEEEEEEESLEEDEIIEDLTAVVQAVLAPMSWQDQAPEVARVAFTPARAQTEEPSTEEKPDKKPPQVEEKFEEKPPQLEEKCEEKPPQVEKFEEKPPQLEEKPPQVEEKPTRAGEDFEVEDGSDAEKKKGVFKALSLRTLGLLTAVWVILWPGHSSALSLDGGSGNDTQ